MVDIFSICSVFEVFIIWQLNYLFLWLWYHAIMLLKCVSCVMAIFYYIIVVFFV